MLSVVCFMTSKQHWLVCFRTTPKYNSLKPKCNPSPHYIFLMLTAVCNLILTLCSSETHHVSCCSCTVSCAPWSRAADKISRTQPGDHQWPAECNPRVIFMDQLGVESQQMGQDHNHKHSLSMSMILTTN